MPGAGARDLAEHMVQRAQPRSNSPTTSYGRAGLANESVAWLSAPKCPPRLSTIGDRILERGHRLSRGRLWERYARDPRRSVGGRKYSWCMAPDDLIALAERQRVHALDALEGQVRSSRVLDVHARGPKATNG